MEPKQAFNMITLTLGNGEKLAAPVGIWLSAMLAAMGESKDSEIKKLESRVKELVGNMIKDQQSRIVTPRHHVLNAEPLNLGVKVRGLGGNGNG